MRMHDLDLLDCDFVGTGSVDQKVSEATRIAEQKARQLQALRNLRGEA